MIPRKIHYCWFGGKEMPPLNQACFDTWKMHLKEYEFIRWDESNCPRSDFIEYHLEHENWAFVSDYVRLYALYTQGGVYLDTDFEVLKPFEDLLDNNGFVAWESDSYITNGIAGSIKGNTFFKDCMDWMIDIFKNQETYQTSAVVTTNVYQSGNYNMKVYDKQYFYPYNPYDSTKDIKILMNSMITDNTFAIHHWAKSWKIDEEDVESRGTGLCVLLKNILGKFKFLEVNKKDNK